MLRRRTLLATPGDSSAYLVPIPMGLGCNDRTWAFLVSAVVQPVDAIPVSEFGQSLSDLPLAVIPTTRIRTRPTMNTSRILTKASQRLN